MYIAELYRYPVKGLSPERLPSVHVATGEGFPFDRCYALLRTSAEFDPGAPVWLAKSNFVMLMLHERIASLKTHFSDAENTLEVGAPDGRKLSFALGEASGQRALEQFFAEFMPKQLPNAPRLVEAAGHQFTDKAPKYVSLINLASVRELEKRWGQTLDARRFRANVYIDDAEPFSELNWVGCDLRLGAVKAHAAIRNGRCAATNVNPETGERDRNVPGKLREEFGHKDLGIYLSILEGGELREGDRVEGDAGAAVHTGTANAAVATEGQFICTACYYLFDPRGAGPEVNSPLDLPEAWRCPDCGSTREAVAIASGN
ncbi:MAG: MOSC domain-containing protein [Burkholderiales bacterium]|jgi:GntR family transcriptional regulator/MocR family aminotransferase